MTPYKGTSIEETVAFLFCKKCNDYVDQFRASVGKRTSDKYKCRYGHSNHVASSSDCKVIVSRKKGASWGRR